MKKKYIKLRLEIDLEVSDKLFKQLIVPNHLDEFVLQNCFRNNYRWIRHNNLGQITEEEFKSK